MTYYGALEERVSSCESASCPRLASSCLLSASVVIRSDAVLVALRFGVTVVLSVPCVASVLSTQGMSEERCSLWPSCPLDLWLFDLVPSYS